MRAAQGAAFFINNDLAALARGAIESESDPVGCGQLVDPKETGRQAYAVACRPRGEHSGLRKLRFFDVEEVCGRQYGIILIQDHVSEKRCGDL